MPKLSKDTLGKMFSCPHCGKLFRTRQGVSGHIQWKHQHPQKDSDSDVEKMKQLQNRLRIWKTEVKDQKLPDEIGKLGLDILHRWSILLFYFHKLNIELSSSDFKNFFIQNFGVRNLNLEQDTILALKSLELLNPKN